MLGRYLLQRLAGAVPLLLGISLLAFSLIHLAPGDPLALIYGPDIPEEDRAQVRAAWGLDKPLPLQYLIWAGNFLRGDLGRSYTDGRPVLDVIMERIPHTLQLTVSALVFAFVLGISAGMLAAYTKQSAVSRLIGGFATACYALPPFWLALLCIFFFSVQLRWLPSSGIASLRGDTGIGDFLAHLLLPALVLSLREFGRVVRFTEAGLLDIANAAYIRTARAKGLSEARIFLGHALRNILAPLITLAGLAIPGLLGSSIVIETIFAWPGIGRLAYEAAIGRNYPVIMGITIFVGLLVILGNLLADLSYGLVDPRVRASAK